VGVISTNRQWYPPAPKGLESHSPLSHSCRGSLRVTWADFEMPNATDIMEQSQSKIDQNPSEREKTEKSEKTE
jgi:hypothetical protein